MALRTGDGAHSLSARVDGHGLGREGLSKGDEEGVSKGDGEGRGPIKPLFLATKRHKSNEISKAGSPCQKRENESKKESKIQKRFS